jgi:transposase
VIGSTRQVRVHAYGKPADLRKGFDGLSALVTRDLREDPLSGELFLFTNRTRKRAKVLLWDGTGLCIYAKRLEQSCFACLWREGEGKNLRLTLNELQLFLDGSALVGRVEVSPPAFIQKTLARRV